MLSSNNYIIYADGKNVTDIIYPIGSLYWSSKSTNPASLFGGSWVQIKDRFILACGDTYTTQGATGGASTVTLSLSNMPSHSHTFTPSGNISMNAHSHGLNNHTHSFSWSGSHSHSHEVVGNNHQNTPCTYVFNGQYLGVKGNRYYGAEAIEVTNDSGVLLAKSATISISGSGTTGGNSGNTTSTTSTGSFRGTQGTTSSNGSGTAFNILPPYVVKYCWERIA